MDNFQRLIKPQPLDQFKGYIQEARSYIRYPFRVHRKPEHKFVLLSQHRSGSTLLVSLLDSHPDIQCMGELFYHPKLFPMAYLRSLELTSRKNGFGFKLMANHIRYQRYRDPEKCVDDLHRNGYQIIKLVRRNLLSSAISLSYAQRRRKFHYLQTELDQGLPRLSLDIAEVKKTYDWLLNVANLQEQVTAAFPHLTLVYEDHLRNPDNQQETVKMITDYLELPHHPMRSNLARIGGNDYSQYVSNLDEIRSVFHLPSTVDQSSTRPYA